MSSLGPDNDPVFLAVTHDAFEIGIGSGKMYVKCECTWTAGPYDTARKASAAWRIHVEDPYDEKTGDE